MRIDLDDPRLTAFALGELEDDGERAAIEAQLADDEAARRVVEEVRATAQLLSDGLRAEAGPILHDDHRQVIEHRLAGAARPRVPFYAYALAASLLAATGVLALLPMVQSAREASRQVAMHTGPVAPAQAPPAAAPAPPRQLWAEALGESSPESEILAMGVTPADEVGQKAQETRGTVAEGTDYFAFQRPAQDAPSAPLDVRAERAPALVAAKPSPLSALPESRAFHADRFSVEALQARRPASGPEIALRGRADRLKDGVSGKPMRGAMGGLGRMGDEKAGRGLERAPEPASVVPGQDTKMLADSLAVDRAGQPPMAGAAGAAVASLPTEERLLRMRVAEPRQEAVRDKDQVLAEVEQQVRLQHEAANREAFNPIVENDFIRALEEPRSTFSIDVDTASYAIVRRYLMDQSTLPPRDAVRIEELVNYFKYDYPQPQGDDPFSVHSEIARCPWNAENRLARIGLKGRELEEAAAKKGSNLVFLADVSGSMNSPDKLPLLQEGLRMLTRNLGSDDRVAIVVYAGSEGLALDSTPGDRKDVILGVIDRMQAGGSTNGGAGIQLAYDIASRNFIPGGVNRVILCTDGDFNVGVTDDGSLQRLITEKAKTKVFLTVLGFGRGNIQDAKMELLADKGNGNYHYIDSPKEAHKVLVEEAGGNLVTIAKDVKIQVDFNPAKVGAYRLLGYENRRMANQDFRDDTKDAGEIGAGHTVTALYELVPPDKLPPADPAERPEFVKPAEVAKPEANESFKVRLRWKKPEEDRSVEREYPVTDDGRDYAKATDDFKFAAAVTSFGLVLRDSKYKGTATLDAALELADASKGEDRGGYRAELVEIIRKAKALQRP